MLDITQLMEYLSQCVFDPVTVNKLYTYNKDTLIISEI